MSLGIDMHIQVETTSFAPKVSFHDENKYQDANKIVVEFTISKYLITSLNTFKTLRKVFCRRIWNFAKIFELFNLLLLLMLVSF